MMSNKHAFQKSDQSVKQVGDGLMVVQHDHLSVGCVLLRSSDTPKRYAKSLSE